VPWLLSIQKFNLLKKAEVQKLYIANVKGGGCVCRMRHKLQLAVVRGTFRMLSTKFIYKSRNVTQAHTKYFHAPTSIAAAATHRATHPAPPAF